MQSTDNRNRGFRPRDGLWLAIALLLHLALLGLPMKERNPRPGDSQVVAIDLQLVASKPSMADPDPVVPEEEPPEPEVHEPIPDDPVEPAPIINDSVAVTELPDSPHPDEIQPETGTLTTASFLHSASEMDWSVEDAAPQRSLGVPVPGSTPELWSPIFAVESNRFDGMTVPGKVEVVDRWLSSDGTRHVVLNTPGGQTLCGSGKAWDPMRPLVEHVMSYKTCGGGGDRTFEMPEQYRR